MARPRSQPSRFLPLAYLLTLTPWLMEYWERGGLPSTGRELLTELVLSAVIGICVFALLKSHRIIWEQRSEIERLAHTDPLTLLGNPRSIEEVLVREIARARRMDRPLSCIFVDLDDFRAVNDRFGHTVGNAVLHAVGECLQSVIRHDLDQAFRYGGDEFLIILPEADKSQAYVIAQRLHQSLGALRPPTVPVKTVRASLGVAQLQSEQTATDLLTLVDQAMRQVKLQGKNLIFDAENLDKE